MDELLNQISADTGVPADLLERAARARAAVSGVSPEDLVAGWAGGEAPAPATAPPPTAEPAAGAVPVEPKPDSGAGQLPEALLRRSAAAKAKREGRPLDEVLVEMGLSPEGATAEAPAAEPAGAAAPAAAPAAAAAAPAEPAAEEPEEEEEPQPVFAGFPRWLAASFIVIPLIALLYAGLSPHGPACGTSGQLDINPATGEAQSCEGAANPFFTMGETVYTEQCASCHMEDGSGSVGPALTGGAVLATFSACEDHVAWVTLGSANWPDATYGDSAKPVMGTGVAMPGYESLLTEQQIAAVSLYERVEFGGEELDVAQVSCGLLPEE